jgi:transcriptional regulator with XRE-family HTH domain
MITSLQMRAARALLGIDQRQLAELSGVSLPTVQRMESSAGNVRGVVDTLTKVVEAFDRAGIELIGENATSLAGGRGVRLKSARAQTTASPVAETPPPPSVKLSAPPPGRRK